MMYVVTCAEGKELDTVAAIRRFGYDAHVPRAVRRYRHRGETRCLAEIMFPGYVFVELPELTAKRYYEVTLLPSVGKFLSRSPLPPDEAEHIRTLTAEEIGISKARLEHGQLVVINGWLKLHENSIVIYSVRQRKATVELNIYGKPHRVVCSVDIEKAYQRN